MGQIVVSANNYVQFAELPGFFGLIRPG